MELSAVLTVREGNILVRSTSGHTEARKAGRRQRRTRRPPSLTSGADTGVRLRYLQVAYPDATITAADVNANAVEFCGRVFGVEAIQSQEDPRQLVIPGHLDLIWCASVVTHVDQDRWPLFLKFFESHLSPRGVLAFTMAANR